MKKLSKVKVLVTGAGGFIGSHLCEQCLAEGAEVKAFVHYNSRNDWGMLEELDRKKRENIEVITGDLRDPDAVRRAVRGISRVFHLGALVGIPYSYLNPADVIQTNVMGTLHVLQACMEANVDRLVQTSTSEVYGTAQYVPMDEAHPLNPQSPYAASKVGSDKLAESFYRSYGLPVVIVRPFNTYGPRQSPRAVIPTIITQALRSETVCLGHLGTTRDFTYVRDTVRGFTAASIATGVEGVTVQLGSQCEQTVADLVSQVGSILNKKLKVVSDAKRRRPETSEVERLYARNDTARNLLQWRPLTGMTSGLEETVRWFRDRSDIFDKGAVYYV
jgi:NAD dependent epimerase/dehydratase